ncbi:MAG: hypothetical protein M1283_03930 [Gammaproteobacteria bacterium]|nr:hypothetical protein [Gammaproteobacteria bacterium]
MRKMIKKFLVLVMMTVVAGCGGGGGGFSTAPGAVLIGNGLGALFQEGVLAIALTTLSSGGSTSITATVVNANGSPYTQAAVNVTFSSNCISLGKATVTSPVPLVNGVATTTYTAQGCSGNDVISATTSVPTPPGVGLLSATGIINVLPPVLGSLEFVSATPTNMGLKGSGGAGLPETSVVVFKVKDTGGNVVAGQSVNFALNTTVGGLSLSPVSAFSNSQGLVQTVVAAGNVATAVRVTATLTGTDPPIRTQSNQLTITTGIPDQNSFTAAPKTINLEEAFDVNGITDAVGVFVGDHFNNPVPDGTAVAFTTEGGQIVSSCTTVAGACTVNWVSSNPRPSDGRVTILATAIGEESFVDSNGNGLLDASGETFTDLAEAFRDDNENGTRDPTEEFLDFNANGVFNTADGKYNGLLCTDTARVAGAICDAPKSLNVRSSFVIVMSGSTATITITPNPISLSVCSPLAFFSNQIIPVTVRVRDARGNVMPADTTITASITNGTIIGDPSPKVPNTATASDFIFNLQSDATQAASAPGTSTISFSNTLYTIGESAGTAVITVNRNGSTTGTSTVNFSVADGAAPAATAGLDYTPTVLGTLTFAPGENVKTFSVPILPDALVEGNENIALTLSNPSGGTLGTAAATLTILDASSATIQPTTPTPPTGSGTPFTCANPKTTGLFTITVKTPKGITTSASATVND